jgi:hypothetical protein
MPGGIERNQTRWNWLSKTARDPITLTPTPLLMTCSATDWL